MATEWVKLTAHCLCKAHVFTTEVPKSELPLEACACHCNSCRHVTGALYSADLIWPDRNVDVSKLSTYLFSDRISIHFCSTCSTPMFYGHPGNNSVPYGLFTGTLQNDPGNLVKFNSHLFVGDTLDGGASMWMRKVHTDGTTAKRYKGHMEKREGQNIEEVPFDWPPSSSLTGYEKKLEDALPIRCKCKGVDLVIHRGKYGDTKPEELPWFVDQKTHKYSTGLCVCDSCRLFGGIDAAPWTFAELSHISFPDNIAKEGKEFPKDILELKKLVGDGDSALGTLKYYTSSAGVQRYFCSNCSASVFYACDSRLNMVDVAVGLLEASDGARAEGLCAWSYGWVDNASDVQGGWREAWVNSVLQEGQQYRDDRGYPVLSENEVS